MALPTYTIAQQQRMLLRSIADIKGLLKRAGEYADWQEVIAAEQASHELKHFIALHVTVAAIREAAEEIPAIAFIPSIAHNTRNRWKLFWLSFFDPPYDPEHSRLLAIEASAKYGTLEILVARM